MASSKPAVNNLGAAATSTRQGYRFIDKDPDMDIVVAAIGNSGLSAEKIEERTARIGRKVSAAAILGWTYGRTRRPQNYTLTSVMLALGFDRQWITHAPGQYEKLEQAAAAAIKARKPARKKAEVKK